MACSWPVFSYRLIMLLMFVWFSTLPILRMKWKTIAMWHPSSVGLVDVIWELPVSSVRTASVSNSEVSHPTLGFRWSSKAQKVVLMRSFTADIFSRDRCPSEPCRFTFHVVYAGPCWTIFWHITHFDIVTLLAGLGHLAWSQGFFKTAEVVSWESVVASWIRLTQQAPDAWKLLSDQSLLWRKGNVIQVIGKKVWYAL